MSNLAARREASYLASVTLHRDGDFLRVIERLRAEIAILRAGNEVLRRVNGKLASRLDEGRQPPRRPSVRPPGS